MPRPASTFARILFTALLCLVSVSCASTERSLHAVRAEPFTLGETPGVDAQDGGPVFVRVIDTGAGCCCAIKMPGNKYMIYDAGNYTGGGQKAFEKIEEVIPSGSTVELLVLSHSDADHLGAVDEICDAYKVKRVIRSGYRRTTATWRNADEAIKTEKRDQGCIDINLSYFEYPAGATYRFGDVFVQMVCGFSKPPSSWGNLGQSEERNAGSIVIRLLYRGKSILFTGDAVGRHIGGPANELIATEKFMVENREVITIDSDVLIAPHHGADNGSSTKFIEEVSPEFVVFPAGHKYQHPRASTAQRFLDYGVDANKMFRTDRGDDEGQKEWDYGRINGHKDKSGDDDVDIKIHKSGSWKVKVEYRN